MVDQKLLKYAKKQLKDGYDPKAIEKEMINSGYSKTEAKTIVANAIESARLAGAPPPPPSPGMPRPPARAGAPSVPATAHEPAEKTVLYIVLSIVIVGSILGAIILLKGGGLGVEKIDCGYNSECLSDAMETCIPAKGRNNDLGMTMYAEVRGISGGKCTIYMKVESATPMMGVDLSGKSMTCRLPMIGGEIDQSGMSSDVSRYCSGSLVSFIEQMISSSGVYSSGYGGYG